MITACREWQSSNVRRTVRLVFLIFTVVDVVEVVFCPVVPPITAPAPPATIAPTAARPSTLDALDVVCAKPASVITDELESSSSGGECSTWGSYPTLEEALQSIRMR